MKRMIIKNKIRILAVTLFLLVTLLAVFTAAYIPSYADGEAATAVPSTPSGTGVPEDITGGFPITPQAASMIMLAAAVIGALGGFYFSRRKPKNRYDDEEE